MRWEKILLNARPRDAPGRKGGIFGPENKWGHTCNAIKGGRYLFVFGGYGLKRHTNDVHVYDTTKHTWSKRMVKGNPPAPRDSHTCTTVGNNLFVFGGSNGMETLNDLHIFDTSSNTWIFPSVRGEGPEAREGHTATLIGKHIFVFGGCGNSHENPEEIHYNNVYILDTEALIWRRAITSGTPPTARGSHTCSAWKNKMIVVAGEDPSDYYCSDVHILDTDTLVWKELHTSGDLLPARAGHTTVTLGKYLFVFGGFADNRSLYNDLHMLNIDTGAWIKVVTTGDRPLPRFSVAGECVDPRKGVIVFIGGCDHLLEPLEDMYYLHTDVSMDYVQEVQRADKPSIRKELKRKCHEHALLVSIPMNDRGVLRLGASPDVCQNMPLPCSYQAVVENSASHESAQSEVVPFEANITGASSSGYQIETTISGQFLRGLVFRPPGFPGFPGFPTEANTHLHSGYSDPRKAAAREARRAKMNARRKSRLESARCLQQEVAHTPTNDIHGMGSTSQEPSLVTPIAFIPNNSPPIEASQSHMMPRNSGTQLMLQPLGMNDGISNLPNPTYTHSSAAVMNAVQPQTMIPRNLVSPIPPHPVSTSNGMGNPPANPENDVYRATAMDAARLPTLDLMTPLLTPPRSLMSQLQTPPPRNLMTQMLMTQIPTPPMNLRTQIVSPPPIHVHCPMNFPVISNLNKTNEVSKGFQT